MTHLLNFESNNLKFYDLLHHPIENKHFQHQFQQFSAKYNLL